MKYYVYGLVDSSDLWNTIRYIGITKSPNRRIFDHIYDSWKERSPKEKWIQQVHSEGGQIHMVILEQCKDRETALQSEKRWIEFGRINGWGLVNRESKESDHKLKIRFDFDAISFGWGILICCFIFYLGVLAVAYLR